jgi:hypothetical protein
MKRGNIAAALLPAATVLMTYCRRRTATNANAALLPTSIDPIFDLPNFILSAVTIYWICDVTYLYVDKLQINITNLLFLISL